MKTFIVLTLTFVTLFASTGCSKKENPAPTYDYDLSPFLVAIEITRRGKQLPLSVLSKTKIAYYDSGAKKYLSHLQAFKDGNDTTKKLLASDLAYYFASTQNRAKYYNYGIPTDSPFNYNRNPSYYHIRVPTDVISTYYIEYPNGLLTDTMYIVSKIIYGKEAFENPCVCGNPVPSVLNFNGKPAVLDTLLTAKEGCVGCWANVYLLKK